MEYEVGEVESKCLGCVGGRITTVKCDACEKEVEQWFVMFLRGSPEGERTAVPPTRRPPEGRMPNYVLCPRCAGFWANQWDKELPSAVWKNGEVEYVVFSISMSEIQDAWPSENVPLVRVIKEHIFNIVQAIYTRLVEERWREDELTALLRDEFKLGEEE